MSITMSIDAATRAILDNQAELLKCIESIDTTLGLMGHLLKVVEVSQEQYQEAKTELSLLKARRDYLKTQGDICRKIRELKSNIQ